MDTGVIRGLHHVGITVRDVTRSTEFFTTLLDCEVVSVEKFDGDPDIDRLSGYRDANVDVVMVLIPGTQTMIELVQFTNPAPGVVDPETYNIGNSHLCLQVDDIQAAFDRLGAAGIEFRSEGPVRESSGPYEGVSWVYLRTEDGITIELCELPDSLAADGVPA